MSDEKILRSRLVLLLRFLLMAGAAVVFYRVLFRPLLPLGLVFLLSALIAKPVDKLHRKTQLPTGMCALLMTLLLLTVLFGGGYALFRLLFRQLKLLLQQLPLFLEGIASALSLLQEKLAALFPDQRTASALFSPAEWLNSLQLPEISLDLLTNSIGWVAASLPDLLLTAVFVLAATVMLTGQRQEILGFVRRQLPGDLLKALQTLWQFLREALIGWCKAQGILAAVTFGLLLVGFLFLRIQAAFLLALAIALADALPVLGAGLLLVPWTLAELLLGYTGRAAGLALLFAAVLTLRNALEPHVVGRQIGLHPFVSLLSFYYGWRLAGIPGMLLLPCLILILVKLQEWGYSKLWR